MKGNEIVTEPASSAAGGWALGKALGGLLGVGIVASALGFFVLLPKTAHEALVRLLCTMAGSMLFGPVLCVALYSQHPELFAAGMKLAADMNMEPFAGVFMVGAPVCALAGLPCWWILGAVVLWLEKRRGKDIGEIAADARAEVARVVTP